LTKKLCQHKFSFSEVIFRRKELPVSVICITRDYEPVAGNKFQFVARPVPGWRGIVDCEVLEVREPALLRYTWVGAEGETPTYVTYRLEPHAGGTRFNYQHTSFTGAGGFVMAKLLGRVRTKMLTVGLPAVLDEMN
jgi:uncharacterized protein YndB with AHSA1/START domain